jgi:hypothetical protein
LIKANDRIELKEIEIDKSHAISKNIVDPPDIDGIGRHPKLAVQQTLVKAVPRSKHELM